MEDVEKIIISTIKSIGCDLPEDVKLLKQCTVEQIVKMTIMCLRAINPEISLSPELPQSMSARFNMCEKIAQLCSDMGYRGEVGFQTFLYLNESQIRNVFMFLVEKLLRAETNQTTAEETADDDVVSIPVMISKSVKSLLDGNNDMLKKSADYISDVPFLSYPIETGIQTPEQKLEGSPKEWKEFVTKQLPFISNQVVNPLSLLPSVITFNSRSLILPTPIKTIKKLNTFCPPAIGNFTDTSTFIASTEPNDHLIHFNSTRPFCSDNGTINKLDDNYENVRISTEKHEQLTTSENNKIDEDSLEYDRMLNELSELNVKLAEAKKIYSEKKESNSLKVKQEDIVQYSLRFLPDSENNVSNLKKANEKLRNTIRNHTFQWKQCKEILEDKCATLKQRCTSKTDKKVQLLNKFSDLRSEILNITEKLQKKTILIEKLHKYRSNIRGTPRAAYTERILDIITNINKQGKEIDKILVDTKLLQKEITNLTDRIEWLFQILDKRINENPIDGDEDDFSADIHTDYTAVYRSFYDTLKMDGEINKIMKEIKDYEEQIQELSLSVTTEAIEQLSLDFQKMKMERSVLKQQHSAIVENGR